MPSRKRPSSLLNGDNLKDVPEKPPDSAGDEALALAEEAEAEAAEAEAAAAAARARAKAIRLRREAAAASAESGTGASAESGTGASEADTEVSEAPDTTEATAVSADTDATTATSTTVVLDEVSAVDDADSESVDEAPEEQKRTWRRLRIPRPPWKLVVVTLVIVCICALLTLSGLMIWHHQKAEERNQRIAEYSAGARQGVVTLMSLDFNHASEDVQRIIDNSTGKFREDFQSQKDDFTKVAQESKVVTDANVNATAVESMTDNSAVVLVAVATRVTNAAGAKEEPRSWRLSVDLAREGEQIKMSKVEFAP